MESFEELIEKFKPINTHQIDFFYAEKFAVSILKLLIKLGVKDGEIYRFDERKKRLRGLDNIWGHPVKMTGISYHSRNKTYDTIEVDGKFYEFVETFMDELDGKPTENGNPLQIFDIDLWSRIYNYLRIEANSKPKNNQRKQLKGSKDYENN